jgi:DNA repair photolyase
MRKIEAKKILGTKNNMNIYRGCTHGCIYCDSRSLCYQVGDFTNVAVKVNAITLLRNELSRKRKKVLITTGAMSDPYVHLEKELQMTRQSLEVILEYGFGIGLLTKSDLVLRDLDLLVQINEKAKAIVDMTITTFDDNLCKILEPNVALTSRRFEVLEILHQHNITTGVWLGPLLPFINDTPDNLIKILDRCHEVGVSRIILFGFGVTMREGNREYFYENLDKHFPGMKNRYIKTFGKNYECGSFNNDNLWRIFKQKCEEYHITYDFNELFSNELPQTGKEYIQETLF